VLPAQARLRRRPEFTAVVRSGRRAGRPTLVLHYLPERAADTIRPVVRAGGPLDPPAGPRAGFVVGRSVGNSVCRHRVSRQLRHLVGAQLHRLPPTADLVVRARPEAAEAGSAVLGRDLDAGLARLLGDRPTGQRTRRS
jgi:ribonuclease P protein component